MEVNAMTQPRQLDNPLYRLIRNEDIKGFNAQKAKDGPIDLCNGDFRGLDLRNLDVSRVLFPEELSADEILMSKNFGTRLRYRTK